jgi:hypothetical protein
MPLFLDNAPIPLQDAIARAPRSENDQLAGFLTDPWVEFFNRWVGQTNASPFVQNSVAVTAQSASIGATDFSGGALGAGYYRLTYYARITQAAGTSSSLTVTFSWTESAVALAVSGAAMTGNTTTTVQSGSVMVLIDDAAPISYSTTYASVGVPVMQYRLSVVIEDVQA